MKPVSLFFYALIPNSSSPHKPVTFDRQGNAAQQENQYVGHPGLCDNDDRVSSSQTTQSWDLALLSPPHRLGILGRPKERSRQIGE